MKFLTHTHKNLETELLVFKCYIYWIKQWHVVPSMAQRFDARNSTSHNTRFLLRRSSGLVLQMLGRSGCALAPTHFSAHIFVARNTCVFLYCATKTSRNLFALCDISLTPTSIFASGILPHEVIKIYRKFDKISLSKCIV
ncbi:MAG: hypothetical protein Ta2B_16970 [Termitinemataceae bacterium]|nr:MAG: hypothetical protein Ta2B_16970 [Termitinemataceae bacterium]